MTLRLRLVLALVGLTLAGLALFGVTTYSLYARSQYNRLDAQLEASAPTASHQLAENAGISGEPGRGFGPGRGGGPSGGGDGGGPGGPLAIYAELRDSSGAVVTSVQLTNSTSTPKLDEHLRVAAGESPRRFTTGSATGSDSWRVYLTQAGDGRGDSVVVASPLGEVATSLRRLMLIETGGGALLLAVLSAGAWLILRRGLRPLEEMADTAGRISAGDLTQRVAPSGGASEVGQLGLALNTMLDGIEAAFAERDATEQRLRQFLADASHELRTPLTSIQGFAELFRLAESTQADADLPTILRRIEEESARMKELVEDLLLLARLDQTRLVERAPVDLSVLAADACTDAVAVAGDRPVILDAPEPVVVEGDQALLRQAIGNLVTNAVRHTPAGTGIDVRTASDDGHAVVVVRDHGPGLDPDALEHVFDRFWQADKARAGGGTGLGLSIVAGVAAEHGGTATAANADTGGAVFTLRLPLS